MISSLKFEVAQRQKQFATFKHATSQKQSEVFFKSKDIVFASGKYVLKYRRSLLLVGTE